MKKAVILFNLGGPGSLNEVEGFLFNLFYDKAIISLPNPLRFFLARLISKTRKKTAQAIYSELGGKSPIVEFTNSQAESLELKLKKSDDEYRTFVVMRYSNPFAKDVISEIEKFNPGQYLLIPLYPQFSTTTSASSLSEFKQLLKRRNSKAEVKSICCHPLEDKFIESHIDLINERINGIDLKNYRFLFSAHGLPQKIVDKGDPYQWQVEQTVDKIINKMAIENLDYRICFQSRVGPLKWIDPDTVDEIKQASHDKKNLVVIPISFVSDHSETLVELDIEYGKMAKDLGIKDYIRIKALGDNDNYIESLKNLCLTLSSDGIENGKTISNSLKRLCPKKFCCCPNNY